MPANKKDKPGLADLKRLRQQAQIVKAPAPALSKRERRRKAGHGAKTAAPAHPPPDPAPPDNTEASSDVSVLSAEDKALFRRVVGSVRRLAPPNRAILPPVPVAPLAVLMQKREAASGIEAAPPARVSDHFAPAQLAGDASHYVQAGHGPDLLKKLSKGKWPVDATLDLHGSTLDEARMRLDGFLRSCLEHQIRCVRIVHGKGYGSKNNASVLKETVRRWLTQLDDVAAYIQCNERDGGAGAVLVLLRSNGRQAYSAQDSNH